MDDEGRFSLGDSPAEGRAAAIAIHILGYLPFIQLEWEQMVEIVEYVAAELEVIAEHGFDTRCVSPDCRELCREDTAQALPGLVSWEELETSSKRVFKDISTPEERAASASGFGRYVEVKVE